MSKKQNIMVERETFEKNEKTYFSYFIKGQVRGRDVKVAIIPPDKGGYTVLDIVFGDAMKAELKITPFEIKDVDYKIENGILTVSANKGFAVFIENIEK